MYAKQIRAGFLGTVTAMIPLPGLSPTARAQHQGHDTTARFRVAVRGDVGWVSSQSTSRGEIRGRQISSTGAELMVRSREANGWLIRAIHWSSRNP